MKEMSKTKKIVAVNERKKYLYIQKIQLKK